MMPDPEARRADIYYSTKRKKWHARIHMGSDRGSPVYFHVGHYRTREQAEKACVKMLNTMLGVERDAAIA